MAVRLLVAAASALMLASCSGLHGAKGNDTGGIIPWHPETEAMALQIAQNHCGHWGKYAVITSVHRVYGDFIAYQCVFDPPLRREWAPRRVVVTAKS